MALGSALAFGLGGRDVAAKMLSDAYDKGQQNKDQVQRDAQVGKDRAQDQAQQQAGRLQGSGGSPATS